jgi:hypothetical protein
VSPFLIRHARFSLGDFKGRIRKRCRPALPAEDQQESDGLLGWAIVGKAYSGQDNVWVLSLIEVVIMEFDKTIMKCPNIMRFPATPRMTGSKSSES